MLPRRRNFFCRTYTARSNLYTTSNEVIERTESGHVSVVSPTKSVPTNVAAERVLWLLQTTSRPRRVLALSGDRSNTIRSNRLQYYLDQVYAFDELERQGHHVNTFMQWIQQTLEGRGQAKRVLSFQQLTSFVTHHLHHFPLSHIHHRPIKSNTIQLRHQVNQAVGLFQTLEAHGITPSHYSSQAVGSTHHELASSYAIYWDLLRAKGLSSYEGQVMEMLELVRAGMVESIDPYTDVVVDQVEQMTPAMVELLGACLVHGCERGTMYSSTSVSSVLMPEDDCSRTNQLSELLVSSLNQKVYLSGSPSTNATLSKYVPETISMEFTTYQAQVYGVANWIKQRLNTNKKIRTFVFCPRASDIPYMTQIFQQQGLHNVYSSTQYDRYLFDEPIINAVFSFIVAITAPDDAKHEYNLLRSTYFFGHPELPDGMNRLSQIMERLQQTGSSHSLRDTLSSILDECTDEKEVDIIRRFLKVMELGRDMVESNSVNELVHVFLETMDVLPHLLNPTTKNHEQEALAVAAFSREVEAAQRIVQSEQLSAVISYLFQIRSSARLLIKGENEATEATVCIDILPSVRTSGTFSSVVDDPSLETIVILMGMTDSQFPGRMKRNTTLSLPLDLLHAPYPIHERSQWLLACERTIYEIMIKLNPTYVLTSYAKFDGRPGGPKTIQKFSRTLAPLWNLTTLCIPETDLPSVDNEPRSASVPFAGYEPNHLSFSQIDEYQRCPYRYYLKRVMGLSITVSDKTIPMMFGNALHQAIATYARATEQNDAKKMAHEALDKAWDASIFLSQQQQEFFLTRAQQDLNTFIARSTDTTSRIVAVEQPFQCYLPKSRIHLHGIWDCLDQLDHGQGQIIIREFKSNPGGVSRPTSLLNRMAQESLQLQLYMTAYEMVYGMPPVGATLETIGGDNTQQNDSSSGIIPYTNAVRDHALEVVDETIRSMRNGAFQPTPSFIECSQCPYALSACSRAVRQQVE